MSEPETRTIPPWTRMECEQCGCDSEATRTESKTITGPYVCSDCKLVEQAEEAASRGAYEHIARWLEQVMPNWTHTTPIGEAMTAAEYVRRGLPGWEVPCG